MALAKSENLVVVKTCLGGDFRRFTVPRQVRLLSFVALLQKLYGYDTTRNELRMQYRDDEGDTISITSDDELAEAFRCVVSGGLLRLQLELVQSRMRVVQFEPCPIRIDATPE